MSNAQHRAQRDEEYAGGVQVIILPTSRHAACASSVKKQPAPWCTGWSSQQSSIKVHSFLTKELHENKRDLFLSVDTYTGTAPARRPLDAPDQRRTSVCGTACSKSHRHCPPERWQNRSDACEQVGLQLLLTVSPVLHTLSREIM